MLDSILVALVVGILTLGIYKLFELLVCRRERLNIIEKLEPEALIDYVKNVNMGLPGRRSSRAAGFSFWMLCLGCLLTGIGLGLLVAYWIDPIGICAIEIPIYGSALCFGGLGLVVAFVVKRYVSRKDRA